MEYRQLALEECIIIKNIVTIHYYEYGNDYIFDGESHDFWEFLCVDKGEVFIKAGEEDFILKKGELFFHPPHEFHSLRANGVIAPNLVVIAFHTDSPHLNILKDRVLTFSDTERHLMAQIIIEARESFSSPLDDPYLKKLERRDHSPFGSEQMIKLYLEQMMILLVRRYTSQSHVLPPIKLIKEKNDLALYHRILDYFSHKIDTKITIEQICKDNLIGRSHLQRLFTNHENCGVMESFTRKKIDQAKLYIRENHLNFTQIAECLGYSSVHYFSRQFKTITGMTPSEYASSIKVISDRKNTTY